MGWYDNEKRKDPVQQLDPGLREFLEKETPDKYATARDTDSFNTPPAHEPETEPVQSFGYPDDDRRVPAASLFQDGRYADLWKTYKAPARVDSGPASDSEVVERYKGRANTVKNAALENCAFEQQAFLSCAKTGDWQEKVKSRVTACAAQRHTFNRCFDMQTKFLMALGYAASLEHKPDVEERIQVHADKLFHQMLDYEKEVEEARATGSQPPPLRSLFNPDQSSRVESFAGAPMEIPGGEEVPADLKPTKPLLKLTPHERELEIRSHNARIEQKKQFSEEVTAYLKKHTSSRAKREEKAVGWFGETIGRLFW
ncbi:hypothetical protein N7539_001523 [Penicillium diatomitis]|uniref:Uncharacterized protein n=1 Tax=Penicillium diatomitis TaxID=2819901 RepID=A0A9W9XGU1_9EURO|nr:uncharacterized protein N7539_001523 [Penicillium diatomitis]KAJ5492777.1 hypothetical protein N7539_001523 [Penicillium diatomitis]